jgi:glycerol-3-phosphate dehydrogenase
LVKPKGDKKTAAISRDHTILVSSSGLITVAGGKWTTYRKMAEDVVNQVVKVGHLPSRKCVTTTLQLHGWSSNFDAWDATSCYGTDTAELEALIQEKPELKERIHPNLPYMDVEIVWAARSEMARTVEDVLARRTRALLLDARASIEAAPRVAKLMAAELGYNEAWIESQVRAFREFASNYLPENLS